MRAALTSLALAAATLTPMAARAEMTDTEKQVYVMSIDPADPGSEYAIAATQKIVIIIPPTVATSVADNASERELVSAYLRLNFIFTGRMRVLLPPRWFEFEDVNTKKRYRFFENDKTTITALFTDLSTVEFRFIGTAIGCPSGLCFEWMVGSETRPMLRRDLRGAGGGRGAPYHVTAVPAGPTMVHYQFTKPYNPYDPANWSGPARPW